MSFLRTVSRASKGATCAIAMAFLALPCADAQTIVIDDDFSDGHLNNGAGQLDFFPTSSAFALDPAPTMGPLDFATGDSGRTIHSLFPVQTLDEFGEVLTFTFDFTTPATISYDNGGVSTNEDFKFGIFDTSGTVGLIDNRTNLQIDFAGPIDTNSGSSPGSLGPNPGLNGLAGIQGEIDNINALGTDLGVRTHNINSDLSNGFPSGQFLQTNNGFDFIAGGDDDVVSILPNTDYTGSISIEYTDATLASFEVTVSMSGTGANGAFDDSFTRTIPIADDPGVSVGVNTNSFDLIAFHATSGAFGGTVGPTMGSSTVGEDNNGIDITNINITFTEASVAPLKGDCDMDGDIDFDDIPAFITILQSGMFVGEADCDCSGAVDFSDIPAFIVILQSQ